MNDVAWRWSCHVCGEERPDERISVRSRQLDLGGIIGQENVRYCNDRLDCVEGSKTFSFFNNPKPEPVP